MREINYSVGSEYWYNDQFAIRTGYFYEQILRAVGNFYIWFRVKYSAFILDFHILLMLLMLEQLIRWQIQCVYYDLNFGAMGEMN